MEIAKVFRIGRSQAIRLPKEFRVEADTVYLRRTGEGFLVITKATPTKEVAGSRRWHKEAPRIRPGFKSAM
jgi:virulence-associated protein VagC